jgi:monomeric isocitrate dehydrogenase
VARLSACLSATLWACAGELAKTPEANIIKLPNVSASLPQLQACISELQAKGYDIPDYPESASTAEELEIAERYGRCVRSMLVTPASQPASALCPWVAAGGGGRALRES